MKRPMVLISLLLCLQGCMQHQTILQPYQDPQVVARSVALEGSDRDDKPPPPPATDAPKAYFTTLTVVAGAAAVVGVVAFLAVVALGKGSFSTSNAL